MTKQLPPRLKPLPASLTRRSQPQHTVPEVTTRPVNFQKRRIALWTGAVTVIVIVGSILGSQLKTRNQILKKIQPAQTADTAAATEADSQKLVDNVTPSTTATVKKQPTSLPLSELQRQIAFLEERRGRLIGQKMSLEEKIQNVREKKKKEAELEAHKKAAIEDKR